MKALNSNGNKYLLQLGEESGDIILKFVHNDENGQKVDAQPLRTF